jgi:hypothetical protein
MAQGKRLPNGHYELICDSCNTEIFADHNMVMLKNELWLQVNNGKMFGALCDKCIEQRLGRSITPADFKPANTPWLTPLCNLFWLKSKNIKP